MDWPDIVLSPIFTFMFVFIGINISILDPNFINPYSLQAIALSPTFGYVIILLAIYPAICLDSKDIFLFFITIELLSLSIDDFG